MRRKVLLSLLILFMLSVPALADTPPPTAGVQVPNSWQRNSSCNSGASVLYYTSTPGAYQSVCIGSTPAVSSTVTPVEFCINPLNGELVYDTHICQGFASLVIPTAPVPTIRANEINTPGFGLDTEIALGGLVVTIVFLMIYGRKK